MIAAVTGASGYVGLNLCALLLERGQRVRALDCRRAAALDSRAEWHQVDILDVETVRRALEGVDVVYHLAAKITLAQDDPVAWQINTEGVRVVAEAARLCGVRRMVHVSSMASFDLVRCQGLLSETSPRARDKTLPVYGRSKLAGEEIFEQALGAGLDGVICYPTALLGPGDWAQPLSRINAVLLDSARGRIPALIAGGLDLVDVRDVALGLMLAAERGTRGERYFIGGEYVEMIDAFRMAADLVGRRGPRLVLPLGLVQAVAAVVTRLDKNPDHPLSKTALETIRLSPHVDHGKASRDLGYEPRPLETTLRDLITFLVHEGHFCRRS